MKKDNPFINLNNTRLDKQRQVMNEIEKNQECPFCQENLEKYHKQDILRKGNHWILTKNQWPYEHTDPHLLAISTYHAESLSDLKKGSFNELQYHLTWAEKEFHVDSGGVAMRFGNINKNGATVKHLHVHIIVPSSNKPQNEAIKFKIS